MVESLCDTINIVSPLPSPSIDSMTACSVSSSSALRRQRRPNFIISSKNNEDEIAFPLDEVFETPVDDNLSIVREECEA